MAEIIKYIILFAGVLIMFFLLFHEQILKLIDVLVFEKRKVIKVDDYKYIVSKRNPYVFYDYMKSYGWAVVDTGVVETFFEKGMSRRSCVLEIKMFYAIWTSEGFSITDCE